MGDKITSDTYQYKIYLHSKPPISKLPQRLLRLHQRHRFGAKSILLKKSLPDSMLHNKKIRKGMYRLENPDTRKDFISSSSLRDASHASNAATQALTPTQHPYSPTPLNNYNRFHRPHHYPPLLLHSRHHLFLPAILRSL